MIPISVYLFLVIELLAVSYGDLKTKKIPNIWSILNLFIFVLLILILPDYYKVQWKMLFYSFAFLFVGFMLFLVKIMGGGDSKFLFTFYLLVPVSAQDKVFIFLLYSTLIIGSLIFLMVTFKNFYKIIEIWQSGQWGNFKKIYGTKFSFAPVMLFSWIWMGWEIKIIS